MWITEAYPKKKQRKEVVKHLKTKKAKGSKLFINVTQYTVDKCKSINNW